MNYIKDSTLPDCVVCKNSRVLPYADGVVQCGCTKRGRPLMRFLDTTVGQANTDVRLGSITPMDDPQVRSIEKMRSFVKWWDYGKSGLYLWSKSSGNGKTLLASATMNEMKMPSQAIEASVLWDALRSCYESGESQKRYLNVAMYTPALLLDDLGMGSTDKSDEWLTDILNARMSRGLLTIITSNFHPSQLPKASDRLVSRLQAHTHPMNLTAETDYRVQLSRSISK